MGDGGRGYDAPKNDFQNSFGRNIWSTWKGAKICAKVTQIQIKAREYHKNVFEFLRRKIFFQSFDKIWLPLQILCKAVIEFICETDLFKGWDYYSVLWYCVNSGFVSQAGL